MWKAWRASDKLLAVDFKKEIAVVGTTDLIQIDIFLVQFVGET